MVHCWMQYKKLHFISALLSKGLSIFSKTSHTPTLPLLCKSSIITVGKDNRFTQSLNITENPWKVSFSSISKISSSSLLIRSSTYSDILHLTKSPCHPIPKSNLPHLQCIAIMGAPSLLLLSDSVAAHQRFAMPRAWCGRPRAGTQPTACTHIRQGSDEFHRSDSDHNFSLLYWLASYSLKNAISNSAITLHPPSRFPSHHVRAYGCHSPPAFGNLPRHPQRHAHCPSHSLPVTTVRRPPLLPAFVRSSLTQFSCWMLTCSDFWETPQILAKFSYSTRRRVNNDRHMRWLFFSVQSTKHNLVTTLNFQIVAFLI